MPKLRWVILCLRALIDQTNNLTIVQTLDELGLPPPPPEAPSQIGTLIPFPITVVTLWVRESRDKPEMGRGRMRVVAPDGKVIVRGEFVIDIEKFQRARAISELPGIPYHGPGTYSVRIDVEKGTGKWRSVGEAEFLLHHNVQVAAVIEGSPEKKPRARRRAH